MALIRDVTVKDSEIVRAQEALELLAQYDNARGDGWPCVSVQYCAPRRCAVISFFFRRGGFYNEFLGDEFADGMTRLEVLINEQRVCAD